MPRGLSFHPTPNFPAPGQCEPRGSCLPCGEIPFAFWRALPLLESSNLISFLPREVGKAWLEQSTVEDTQGLGVYFLGKAVPGS